MSHPISEAENRRLKIALAEHLGLDPEKVHNIEVTTDTMDGTRIEWSGVARMPHEEFVELFNSLKLRVGQAPG